MVLGADADGAHAGICLETPEPINAAMDQIIKLQVREAVHETCEHPPAVQDKWISLPAQ